MHMQKEPRNMQKSPKYNFAPIDIYKFFSKKITYLIKAGVKISNITGNRIVMFYKVETPLRII